MEGVDESFCLSFLFHDNFIAAKIFYIVSVLLIKEEK